MGRLFTRRLSVFVVKSLREYFIDKSGVLYNFFMCVYEAKIIIILSMLARKYSG